MATERLLMLHPVNFFEGGHDGHGVRDENDEWETQEWIKPKYVSPVACLAKTSELIRSLCDDGQGKTQVPGMRKWSHSWEESGWSLITSLICRF